MTDVTGDVYMITCGFAIGVELKYYNGAIMNSAIANGDENSFDVVK